MAEEIKTPIRVTKIKSFEDIDAWKEATSLATQVIQVFAGVQMDSGFRDKIRDTATDIASNIARGKERESVPEFIELLQLGRGSAAELRTLLHVAGKAGYITSSVYFELAHKAEEIGKMIGKLINSLKKWE